MSDISMDDAEPTVGTDDHLSPRPFRFLLSPEIWSLCQAQPFRFLDLPPELRNRIYEQAFTGSHGLSPHHLTQVNRQIRAESAQMFHAETHTLQVPLQSPKQMTRFLNWIEDGTAALPRRGSAYEFTYTDIDVGVTTVLFTPASYHPARIYELMRSYSPDWTRQDLILWTWFIMLGLDYRGLADDFIDVFLSQPPSALFIEAIDNGSVWHCCLMQFVDEHEPVFPVASFYARQFFRHFVPLLNAMANEEWTEMFLRNVAGFFFMRSMQAGTQVKRKA